MFDVRNHLICIKQPVSELSERRIVVDFGLRGSASQSAGISL